MEINNLDEARKNRERITKDRERITNVKVDGCGQAQTQADAFKYGRRHSPRLPGEGPIPGGRWRDPSNRPRKHAARVSNPRPYEYWGITERDEKGFERVMVALKDDAQWRMLTLLRQELILMLGAEVLKRNIIDMEKALNKTGKRHGIAFPGHYTKTAVKKGGIMALIKSGNGIRKTARDMDVSINTVRGIMRESGSDSARGEGCVLI